MWARRSLSVWLKNPRLKRGEVCQCGGNPLRLNRFGTFPQLALGLSLLLLLGLGLHLLSLLVGKLVVFLNSLSKPACGVLEFSSGFQFIVEFNLLLNISLREELGKVEGDRTGNAAVNELSRRFRKFLLSCASLRGCVKS